MCFSKKKYLKYCYLITCILLALIAFNIVPEKNLDLYRYFMHLDNVKVYGWSYLSTHDDFSSLPVWAVIIYIVSILKHNGFLSAICVFLAYWSVFRLIYKASIKFNLNRSSILLAIFCFISFFNFYAMAAGIRNKLAIAIFCYVLYVDLIECKNKYYCYIIYFLLGFLHPSIFALVILRILLEFYNEKSKYIICTLILLWSNLKSVFLIILTKFSNIPIIGLIVSKMNVYDLNEAYAVANVNLYTFIYMTRLILFIIIFKYYKKKSKNNNVLRKYNDFLSISLCFVVGSIKEYHFFIRFSDYVLILILIPIMYYINLPNKYESSKRKSIVFITLLYESLLFLLFFFVGQYTILKF